MSELNIPRLSFQIAGGVIAAFAVLGAVHAGSDTIVVNNGREQLQNLFTSQAAAALSAESPVLLFARDGETGTFQALVEGGPQIALGLQDIVRFDTAVRQVGTQLVVPESKMSFERITRGEHRDINSEEGVMIPETALDVTEGFQVNMNGREQTCRVVEVIPTRDHNRREINDWFGEDFYVARLPFTEALACPVENAPTTVNIPVPTGEQVGNIWDNIRNGINGLTQQ